LIYLGSDHGGFQLKEEIKKFLEEKGEQLEDLGIENEESCDYPDFAFKVAEKVAETNQRGILICGTGIGMSMAANKVKGVRATLVWDEFTAKMSRNHNNSNLLCLGARVLEKDLALKLVEIWLTEEFEGDRHERRVGKIDNYLK